MTFVTLGTQKFQLNRLLRLLDECVGNGTIRDEIIAQTGASDYEPQHFRCYPFLKSDEFEAHIADADVVVTHGGVGSIMKAFQKEKPVVIFPRLAKYHEHVDDHQLEIAHLFAEKGYALLCNETDNLPQLLEESRVHLFNKYISQTDTIVNFIEDFLRG